MFSCALVSFVLRNASSSIVIPETTEITYGENATITVTANNVTITAAIQNVTGHISLNGSVITVSDLAAGTYTIIVTGTGDANHTGATANATLTVNKAASTVQVLPIADVADGANVTVNFTSTVFNTVTYILYNSTNGIVRNGTASGAFILSDLPTGIYTIVLETAGNENYTGDFDTTSFMVGNPSAVVEINPITDAAYGSDVVVNYNITAGTLDKVVITQNGATVTANVNSTTSGKVLISGLNAGTYTVTIFAKGLEGLKPSNASANFTVTKLTPEITVTAANVAYGNAVVVTVSSTVGGTYTVKVGDNTQTVTLTAGVAQNVTFSGLDANTYNVSVSIADSTNVNAASKNTTVTVNAIQSQVTIADIAAGVYGKDLVINYTITPTEIGLVIKVVDANNNNVSFTKGTNSITVNTVPGTYTVIITNTGNNNILGSSANTTFTIAKSSDYTFTANAASVTVLENATVAITLPNTVNANVTVVVNGKEYTAAVVNGTGSVSIDNLPAKTYTATVTFTGDALYNSGVVNTTFDVTKVSAFTMNATADDVTIVDVQTIDVEFSTDVTGTVSVVYNNKTYSVDVNGSIATIELTILPAGEYNITVTYSGDATYTAKSAIVSFQVYDPVITVTKVKRGYNSGTDFEVTFMSGDKPLANYTIRAYSGSNEFYAITDANGVANFDNTLAVGTHAITIVNPISGEETNTTVTIVNRLINNANVVMDYLDGTTYRVQAIGDDGNHVGAGYNVVVTIGSTKYNLKTDPNGYVSAKITNVPGTYTITAQYAGVTVSNKLTVKQILKASSTSVKKSAKSKTIKATLKYTNGKAIKGKVLKLKIKGKTIKAKTNKKGIAKFKLTKKVLKKLKAGKKYKFTVTYQKDTIKKTLKVKK